jgi:hypothetical protein
VPLSEVVGRNKQAPAEEYQIIRILAQ